MESSQTKRLIEENLHYEEAKRLLIKLVRIPSPQTDRLEEEPQVLEFIKGTVKPELEEAGIHPIIDDRGNLIVSMKGRDAGKRLLLVAYAMNHPAGNMKNPYSGAVLDGTPYEIQGECVWGRGACEQKGSLAAMMLALKIIAKSQAELAADLMFVTSTAGESGRHDSLNYVLGDGKVQADWAIVDGPPQIQLGNKGRVDVLIVVGGTQCHSSRPWEGVNAIEGATRVLEKLQPHMPYPLEKAHPKLGRVSLSATSIESLPKATHTIPSQCRILLDRRLLPGDDPEQAVRAVEAIVGKVDPFTVEVQGRAFTYPSEVSEDAEVVRTLAQAIRTMLGREPEYTFATAALDTGLLNMKGIQSINYGARDIRFQHTDHEVVSVNNVFEAAKVFAFIALHR